MFERGNQGLQRQIHCCSSLDRAEAFYLYIPLVLQGLFLLFFSATYVWLRNRQQLRTQSRSFECIVYRFLSIKGSCHGSGATIVTLAVATAKL